LTNSVSSGVRGSLENSRLTSERASLTNSVSSGVLGCTGSPDLGQRVPGLGQWVPGLGQLVPQEQEFCRGPRDGTHTTADTQTLSSSRV
jgi:hypothetical protein